MLFAALALASCAKSSDVIFTQPTEADSVAELSFAFSRNGGIATNQFAVWVEDSHGRYVKTLYATNFTASGGWKRRKMSIPLWVEQSGLANMSQTQIDSLTGATPKNGNLTYRWDGKDSQNNLLPPGDYVIYLEGNLRMGNRVLYHAPIQIGHGATTSQITSEYIGKAGKEQKMISAVNARTIR